MDYYALKSAEKKLRDGDLIYLPSGPQTIRIDPEGMEKRHDVYSELEWRKQRATGSQYSESKFNRYFDAAKAADNLQQPWESTIDVSYDTLVTITIRSDYNGKILGVPRFDVSEVSSAEMKTLKDTKKRKDAAEEAERKKREQERAERKAEEDRKGRIKAAIIWGILGIICLSIATSSSGFLSVVGIIGICFCVIKFIARMINPNP